MLFRSFGNISGNNDFIYYGNGLRADLEMNIPLAFSASELTLKDTADFNLGNVSMIENINSGKLNVRVNNGFPFSTGIQAYLLSDQGMLLDSLFSLPGIANAGVVNSNLVVIQPTLTILEIPLNQEKISHLQSAKKIILDRKSTRLNSSHTDISRMPSSA